MLVSRQHRIAFAHYPKTAGTSLQRWFIESFSDSTLLLPNNPHLDVASSMKVMQPNKWQREITRLQQHSLRFVSPTLAAQYGPWQTSLQVIGVMRDPFEMLVSLFEFWQRVPFAIEPTNAFIGCARHGCFRDFLAAAVIGGRVPNYKQFFNVGGPLWHNTRLLDFESLKPALDVVSVDFGVLNPRPLPELNRSLRGQRNLDCYRDEAGPLMAEVHRHFRWYYEEGVHLMIRGKEPLRAAA